jgi:hypothetical protein
MALEVAFVRSFQAVGWNFTCFGSDGDIGNCSATRKVGRATIKVAVSKSDFSVHALGKCVGVQTPSTEDLNLESLSTRIAAQIVNEKAAAVIRALPKRCNARLTLGIQRALREAAAYLIDYAD